MDFTWRNEWETNNLYLLAYNDVFKKQEEGKMPSIAKMCIVYYIHELQ